MVSITENFKHWLKEDNSFPKDLVIDGKAYTILDRNEENGHVKIGNRIGTKGFVLKVKCDDKTSALKISIPSAYKNKEAPIKEKTLSNALSDHDVFIIPEVIGHIRIPELDEYFKQDDKFYCFILKWVDGTTLKNIIEHDSDLLSPENIQKHLEDILDAVATLALKKLKHDDLHLGNIMLVEQGTILKTKVIKIVDMGSLKCIDDTSSYGKRREDFYNFVAAVVHFRDALFKNRKLYVQHQQFIANIDQLIFKLNDDDGFRAFGDSIQGDDIYRGILKEVEGLSSDNLGNPKKLNNPFDALSAEHIPTNDILLKLFVHYDEFYTKLTSNTSLLMHGPRGCGKTMAFRYVSVNTQLSSISFGEELKKIPYFGVYIGCSQLQPYLSWINNVYSDDTSYYQKSVVTFFSLYLCTELVETFYNVSLNQEAQKFYEVKNTKTLTNFIFAKIQEQYQNSESIPELSTSSPIQHLKNILEKIKAEVYNSVLNKKDLPIILGDAFIPEVSLKAYGALNKSRKIAYLLDDYTFNRIPEKIQEALNKIVWFRSHYQQFSISSEKNSYSTKDYQGANYDDTREYDKVDFGSMIVAGDDNENHKSFIIDMMNHRFKSLGWKVKLEDLIGASKYRTHTSLLEFLKNHSGGSLDCYHGIDIISYLWSGDIALILQLLSKILKDISSDQEEKILPSKQHKAIKTFSETYERYIQNFHVYGKEMSSVAKSFGDYSHSALKNDGHMIRNLEFSLSTGEDIWALLKNTDPSAHGIAQELIKKTIFIELIDSKAKEENKAKTVRWQLKKMYYPAHNITFGKNHYLDIRNIDEFVCFLTKPNQFLDEKKRNKTNKNKTNKNQMELWK